MGAGDMVANEEVLLLFILPSLLLFLPRPYPVENGATSKMNHGVTFIC
jgi:hypothetical protein